MEWLRLPTGSSPLGTTKRMPAAPISLQPRTRSSSAAAVTTSGLSSGQAARSSLSPPFITAVPKYVATSTPLEREWANSRVIDGGLVDFVRHLKGRPGGDIGVHGSISVARTLLAADVVDELRLVIAPTIVGSGQRLFDGLPTIRLEKIRSTASPSGHLLVDYRVVR